MSKDSAQGAVETHALGPFLADLECRKGGGGAGHISCALRLSPEEHETIAEARMSHPLGANSIATRTAMK